MQIVLIYTWREEVYAFCSHLGGASRMKTMWLNVCLLAAVLTGALLLGAP